MSLEEPNNITKLITIGLIPVKIKNISVNKLSLYCTN